MKKISNLFFSMTSMGVLLLIFAVSIAAATFIGNDFGMSAAKAVVYNAIWFDILLGLLTINLVANIFRYKMYKKKKFTMFLFHIAFLVILLGAGITRFISYEGILHLREGETSNTMISDRTYIQVEATKGKTVVSHAKHVLLSELTPTDYKDQVSLDGQTIKFQATKFIRFAREVIVKSALGQPIVILAASSGSIKQNFYLRKGESKKIGKYTVRFGGAFDPHAVNILSKGDSLTITAPDTLVAKPMGGGASKVFIPNSTHLFVKKKLFTIGKLNLVLTKYYHKGKVDFIPGGKHNSNLMDVAQVKIQSGNQTKEVYLRGGTGFQGEKKHVNINGIAVTLSYGAKIITFPFSIKLNAFQLTRYPGSMSPSSYASQVTVIDSKDHKTFPYHIFMNHVLNYKGYRFFQSSYDRDELGTILSVNHDYWGTFFTYIGYILLAIGMFLSLLNTHSYFASLGRYLKKFNKNTKGVAGLLLVFLLLSSPSLFAQGSHTPYAKIPTINKEQAQKFGHLVVQSNDGRIKPVNTLASQLLRKLMNKNSFNGLSPDQVFLGMMSEPLIWEAVPMIRINDKKLAKIIGIKGKYASYLDFINMKNHTYKLQSYVTQAYETKPSHRGMFDREVMKVDERMNIAYMVYAGQFLKMIPDPNHPDHSWYSPASKITQLSGPDSAMVVTLIPEYLNALAHNNVEMANELLAGLAKYQKRFGAAIMPSQTKINAEILYNKMMIFFRLAIFYSLIGFILLILVFADILRSSSVLKKVMKFLLILIVIGFAFQTFGLGLRWYIAGHAPWSNGYESMIYLGWITMLAGLLFSRRSMMTVAATTILASIILFVAHLSWMDPEITNLVPVLKSYWLTIHVSVIIASYGFLALGAMLGFLNLLLMIFKTPKNFNRMTEKIAQLTTINRRTLIVGLYLLAMGTFIGGVWANESWGRYWSWDPKEGWALVSILVYSFIVHMRFIPGLKSKYSFNMASVLGFFSILMTYFGVNYYLAGLHSYASGTPIPIPHFVYYTVAAILGVVAWSYFNEQKINKEVGSGAEKEE